MNENKIANQPAPNQPKSDQPMAKHDGFEHEDLRPRGPYYFLVGLALLGLVIYLLMFGLYRFLDSYAKVHQPPLSPMATPQADTRSVTHEDTQTFPLPRLEENERTQLGPFIEDQDRKLATYDWVDKNKGTVRIPIDRAMELIVERGLPVRPPGASPVQKPATQTSAPARKQTPKARTTKAAASGH
jgi:hypothetical protein